MQIEADGGYVAEAYRCHGCAAVARVSDRYASGKADARGLYINVRPRPKRG